MMRLWALASIIMLASATPTWAGPPSGAHDFDWEIDTWTTKVRVRTSPFSGEAPKRAEYAGTSLVKPLLDGRANLVELSVAGTSGKIEVGSLRLYGPQTRQ